MLDVNSINRWLKSIGEYSAIKALCELRLSRKIPFEGSDRLTKDDIAKLERIIVNLQEQIQVFGDVCDRLSRSEAAALTDRLLRNNQSVDKEVLKTAKKNAAKQIKLLIQNNVIYQHELNGYILLRMRGGVYKIKCRKGVDIESK